MMRKPPKPEPTAVALAQRDRLLALWVAEKLGKQGADAQAYVDDVLQAEDILHRTSNDLMKARVKISRAQVCAAAEDFLLKAQGSVE